MRRRWRTGLLVLPVCLVSVASSLPADTPTPTYPASASAIKVDAVVLDAGGRPVRGLTREDFTVLEDGRPQAIVGFDECARPGAQATRPPDFDPGATNVAGAGRTGRSLALLVDDLGISAAVAIGLKASLAAWIGGRADGRDEVTIVTTSGSQWWSDEVGTGRGDLLAVLDRIRGRMAGEGAGGEQMSEAEAYRIDVLEQSMEYSVPTDASRSRPIDAMPAPGGSVTFAGSSAIERVAERWLDSRVCPPCSNPVYEKGVDCREIRQCLARVRLRASEVHAAARRRTQALLQALARLSAGLAAAEGRKSILVVSEALVNDASIPAAFRDAVDAAHRANAAVYFVDARGLAGASFDSAAAAAQPPRGQDAGAIAAEEGVLATGGGESLAEATGGTLTRSNDLAAGLERMAEDSAACYLIGYQPPGPPDGKWHRLEVRVARPGVTVRARRGYRAVREDERILALPPVAAEPAPRKPAKGGSAPAALASRRALDPTLLAGRARGALPLRLAAYLADANGAGQARVVVVLEVDNGAVVVSRAATPWRARLDLSIVTAGLHHPPVVPIDERLDLTLGPGDVGNGWWLVKREIWLPPGVSQVRVLVRDVASGAAGLVTQRVEVPDLERPYVSTPMLSDLALPGRQSGEPPRIVPTARRRFGGRDTLYCQYEVHGFGGLGLAGVPQLFGGYRLERPDGSVVLEEAPYKIDLSAHRAVRRVALPLAGLADGDYSLVLTIQDRLAGLTMSRRVAFEVAHSKQLSDSGARSDN